ncbi:hypothetical protein BH23BAC4_BH23BAC4_06840 [soil metagenome]
MPKIQALPTPNPNSLKFVLNGDKFPVEGLSAFGSAREAEHDPLGNDLFSLRGVANVLIVPEFVTVTKHPAADWNLLVQKIERILTDHIERAATI